GNYIGHGSGRVQADVVALDDIVRGPARPAVQLDAVGAVARDDVAVGRGSASNDVVVRGGRTGGADDYAVAVTRARGGARQVRSYVVPGDDVVRRIQVDAIPWATEDVESADRAPVAAG